MQIDLNSTCGLNLKLDSDKGILVLPDTMDIAPRPRTLKEIREVLFKPVDLPDDTILYYMYRDVSRAVDKELFQQHGLRYDMVVVHPRMLGEEFVKTLGHYHPIIPNASLTYPEIYEVVYGQAHFLLQKMNGSGISGVIVIEARAGDKVIMPPGFGHISINPTSDFLVMANLVEANFTPVYQPIIDMKGGAYFELSSGFVKNENYGQVPELRMIKAPPLETFNLPKLPLYRSFITSPDSFKFLVNPQDFFGQN